MSLWSVACSATSRPSAARRARTKYQSHVRTRTVRYVILYIGSAADLEYKTNSSPKPCGRSQKTESYPRPCISRSFRIDWDVSVGPTSSSDCTWPHLRAHRSIACDELAKMSALLACDVK
eukprot:6961052-Prymnesium_polylepis.2